jgi:hypothetical protein
VPHRSRRSGWERLWRIAGVRDQLLRSFDNSRFGRVLSDFDRRSRHSRFCRPAEAVTIGSTGRLKPIGISALAISGAVIALSAAALESDSPGPIRPDQHPRRTTPAAGQKLPDNRRYISQRAAEDMAINGRRLDLDHCIASRRGYPIITEA